jgi:hypothetical protein
MLVQIGQAVLEERTFKVVNIIRNCPKSIKSIWHDRFDFEF